MCCVKLSGLFARQRCILLLVFVVAFMTTTLLSWCMPVKQQILGREQTIFTSNNAFYSIGSPELARIAASYFQANTVIHNNGVAYDYYSISELGQIGPGPQWLTFPLPNELGQSSYSRPWQPPIKNPLNIPLVLSPPTKSGLAFVEQIYVVTDESFTDRHKHLKSVFRRHNIPIESIKWLFKWNRTTCSMAENRDWVRKRLNLKSSYSVRRNQCPIIMKHLDAWEHIASSNYTLALILEDDPLFVPFFKEKFNRMIYTAIRTGAFRINKTCLDRPTLAITDNEWIKQEPMIVIGACFDMHNSKLFEVSNPNAQPILSTRKNDPSRCAHAYLLTTCTAKALLEQILLQYVTTDTADFLQNMLVKASTILQSFWIDPPLVHQGNRLTKDMDRIPTFKETKYNLNL